MKYLLTLLVLPLLAFTFPDKPNGHVNDYTGSLSQQEINVLNTKLREIETNTKVQAAVAIFPDMAGENIDDFSNTLARKWKLGSKESNDGLLLVLAMKEHKMRIEVGYGLEGLIPDAQANRIIREDLRPSLKQGNLYQGLMYYVEHIGTLVTPKEAAATTTVAAEDGGPSAWWFLTLLALPFGFLFFRTKEEEVQPEESHGVSFQEFEEMAEQNIKNGKTSKGKKASRSTTYVPVPVPVSHHHSNDDDTRSSSYSSSSSSDYSSSSSSDSGSSWGGGSDSGFSGGGGDFGGGGSSGDW